MKTLTKKWVYDQLKTHKTIYELAGAAVKEGLVPRETRGNLQTKALYTELEKHLKDLRENDGWITRHNGRTYCQNPFNEKAMAECRARDGIQVQEIHYQEP